MTGSRPARAFRRLPGGTLEDRLLRGPGPPSEGVSAMTALAGAETAGGTLR